jgi:Na+-translocating ferredoxin:NAD+ oxidoreductase RnfG subunit
MSQNKQMKEAIEKYKITLILLFYAVVFFLVAQFVFFPFGKKIEEKAYEIQARNLDSQMERERTKKIPEMEEDWKKIQEKKDVFAVIIGPNEEVDFIKKMESIAEATGNKISLKILEKLESKDAERSKRSAEKKEEGDKPIKESLGYEKYIILEIILEGGYSNLVDFVKKIENDSHYVNIVSINAKKVLENESGLTASVPQSAFFQNSPELPGQLSEKKEIISSALEAVVYIEK